MKTKRKTPDIRFRGFSDDWEQRKLGEFGKATGGTSIESEFVEGGRYKVISIGSYSEDSIYTDQGIRANETKKTSSRILDKDNLTMILNDKTASGNIIGRVLLIDTDDTYVYNQRTQRIEVNKDEYSPVFLYHYLNAENIRSKIIKASQGNTQIYVNWSAISELQYLIPKSLSEQFQISTFFTNLDNLITLHQRKLQQLKEVKRGMLLTLLICDKENNPIVRFNGYKNVWKTIKLGDNYKFLKGKGLTLKDFSNQGKSKGIAYGHLYTIYSEVILEVNLFVKDETVKSKSGDLLFPGSSTVPFGTAQTNAIMIDGVNLGGDIVIARPKDNSNYAPFMSYLINIMKEKMYPITVGTTITHMYGKDISSLKYNIPKYEEQLKIGDFIQRLDRMIELQEREIELLEETKKGFLQKMFV